ncbi:hypothetical protein C8Q78DRAFT_1074451 [Trametes maxima]|nr:hypothetical protein C8Q78DRAFT_1074451 [Trametes maxima]
MSLSPPPAPDLLQNSLLHPAQPAYDHDDPHSPALGPPPPKKKHVCAVCNRAFTTSGHLSRHARIHTGERNHKCPFPGCETRCSRQDNLQQHPVTFSPALSHSLHPDPTHDPSPVNALFRFLYSPLYSSPLFASHRAVKLTTLLSSYRIHLSPGSRRNSGSATRAAMSRASANERPRSSRRRSKNDTDLASPSPPPPVPSPPLSPPPLAQAYQPIPAHSPTHPSAAAALPEPPDTPPPLAPAYPTLPPPSAPVYSQHSLPGRDAGRSSTSTPDAAYPSPVSYTHPSLAPAPYAQYEDSAYPPSQDSRTSSFGRSADDQRWTYPQQQQQSYPTSESDRYSPVSPAANAQYADPASPVEAYNTSAPRSHGNYHVSQQPQESYFGHYQQRQTGSALGSVTSPTPLAPSQQSSHRHSIAHISNPVRQHSPTSTTSASPVVSHPPTPGYGGYMASSMGSFAESPPGSVSPVAPASQLPSGMVATYGSYETNSLASAGYTHPPQAQTSAPVQTQAAHPTSQAGYARTLPSLSPVHARGDGQAQSSLATHYNYGQTPSYHTVPSNASIRRTSPPPVLAPIQGSRVVRRDSAGVPTMRYASPAQLPPQAQTQTQPAIQSLATVGRSSGHAYSYPPTSHSHSHPHSQAHPQTPPAYSQAPSSYAPGGSGSGTGSGSAQAAGSTSASAFYYTHARDASPEAAEQYLELHQPQPQRVVAGSAPTHAHTHAAHGHQYMQTGAALTHAHAHSGHSGHSAWRTDDYRGRNSLVQ